MSSRSQPEPSLRQIGFFHFGCPDKSDPCGSLENTLGEARGLEACLITLPEAFNVLGGYYDSKGLDERACLRLQTLSAEYGIWFVVGLIEPEIAGVPGYNCAYLVDGTHPPLLLSRKQCGGSSLYTPCGTDDDTAVAWRGAGVTALVCDDAAERTGTDQGPTLDRVKRLRCSNSVLCVPAYMTITLSEKVARNWASSITVALANGCHQQPSVIIHQGREVVQDRVDLDKNQIKTCCL